MELGGGNTGRNLYEFEGNHEKFVMLFKGCEFEKLKFTYRYPRTSRDLLQGLKG